MIAIYYPSPARLVSYHNVRLVNRQGQTWSDVCSCHIEKSSRTQTNAHTTSLTRSHKHTHARARAHTFTHLHTHARMNEHIHPHTITPSRNFTHMHTRAHTIMLLRYGTKWTLLHVFHHFVALRSKRNVPEHIVSPFTSQNKTIVSLQVPRV